VSKTKTAIGAAAARAAVFAALIGLAAGCGTSLSSGNGSPPATTPMSTAPASTASASTAPASTAPASASVSPAAAGFAGIVEPWDPGHPARIQPPTPASCYSLLSTVDIEQCFNAKTEDADAEIDTVQQAKYAAGSPAQQEAILAQDSAWVNARGPVCGADFHSGGTIDLIDIAACLLDESTARLDAVQGIVPPEAMLKSTDIQAPDAWSWYTTPEGSRIAEFSSQGDQSGGGIIAWVIIGGADGFVVNPMQFYFSSGSFTDYGNVVGPNPAYHRVGTGQVYGFDIDYTNLSQAPNGGSTGGFVYAPGTPVAIWQ
jgi:uncharacterized protein YecT (DUF1311 family)